jgi:hypothetical protein
MKITIMEDWSKECLGIVRGRNLEECLDAAVKKTGRALKTLTDYPNGIVAIMYRRRKQSLY